MKITIELNDRVSVVNESPSHQWCVRQLVAQSAPAGPLVRVDYFSTKGHAMRRARMLAKVWEEAAC